MPPENFVPQKPQPNIFELIPLVREQSIPVIPESDVEFTTMRSGGKGGQNVNKVESAVRLSWNIDRSRVLSAEQKAYLLLASEIVQRMDSAGTSVNLRCDSERSQLENKRLALERLNNLIASVLDVRAERKPTAPTYGSTQRRLDTKTREARKKQERRRGWDE